jgi:hypothetical protein
MFICPAFAYNQSGASFSTLANLCKSHDPIAANTATQENMENNKQKIKLP